MQHCKVLCQYAYEMTEESCETLASWAENPAPTLQNIN